MGFQDFTFGDESVRILNGIRNVGRCVWGGCDIAWRQHSAQNMWVEAGGSK